MQSIARNPRQEVITGHILGGLSHYRKGEVDRDECVVEVEFLPVPLPWGVVNGSLCLARTEKGWR